MYVSNGLGWTPHHHHHGGGWRGGAFPYPVAVDATPAVQVLPVAVESAQPPAGTVSVPSWALWGGGIGAALLLLWRRK